MHVLRAASWFIAVTSRLGLAGGEMSMARSGGYEHARRCRRSQGQWRAEHIHLARPPRSAAKVAGSWRTVFSKACRQRMRSDSSKKKKLIVGSSRTFLRGVTLNCAKIVHKINQFFQERSYVIRHALFWWNSDGATSLTYIIISSQVSCLLYDYCS